MSAIRYRYCPECAVRVSGSARVCPDCGHTLEKSVTGAVILVAVVVLTSLLLVALLAALTGGGFVDPGV